jgi:hypothetical protein
MVFTRPVAGNDLFLLHQNAEITLKPAEMLLYSSVKRCPAE